MHFKEDLFPFGWHTINSAYLEKGEHNMGLLGRSNSIDKWVASATDQELTDNYNKRRKQWEENGFGGDGRKPREMRIIENEMNKRAGERQQKNPNRNTDPYFHWTDKNRWERD